MSYFEQFLLAYARGEYDKALELYDKYNTEFPTLEYDIVDLALTKIDINMLPLA